MYSYGPLHMAKQKQDDQLEHTYSSYVRIRDIALKTCQKRWIIRRSGERGSGISVLAARHDNDSNCFYSCSFKPEMIKIGQSSQKIYRNNILNFQESKLILNACTKKSGNFWKAPRITFFSTIGLRLKKMCERFFHNLLPHPLGSSFLGIFE